MTEEIKKETPENRKRLKQLMASINKDIQKSSPGTMACYFAGDVVEKLKPKFIPCNVPQLNNDMGGGFARGAMHLLAGEPGSGKTATAMSIIKSLQDQYNEDCVYVCLEPPFPYEVAMKNGVDLDRLIIMDPTTYGEKLVDHLFDLLWDSKENKPQGVIGGVVWDSLNNVIPKRAIDRAEKEDSAAPGMADRAKVITDLTERMQGRGMLRAGETNDGVVVILIVQLRANISGYGGPTQISCGHAVQYNCKTVTIMKKKIESKLVSGVKQPKYQDVTYSIVKQGIKGHPIIGTYRYDYDDGLDDTPGLVEQGLSIGVITKEGQKIYVFEQNLDGSDPHKAALGRGDLVDYLKDNNSVKEKLRQVILLKTGSISTDITEDVKALQDMGLLEKE